MATDRENIDMHPKNTDSDRQTDTTASQQLSRPPESWKSQPAPTPCSSDQGHRARPHTSSEGPSTPGGPQHGLPTTPERDYKATHPIGSRKVTENVITYHEPIFQSVANTLFNQKNFSMGKRKLEEDRMKMESSSPDSKRRRVENIRGNVSDPNVKIKKKCSIENIIERIRTEKTMSRGSGSGAQQGQSGTDEAMPKLEDYQQPTPATANRDVAQKEMMGVTCETPLDLSGKSIKTEQVVDTIKKEKESPKKQESAKALEMPILTKMDIKQESKEISSPVKYTKLIETSKETLNDIKADVQVKKSAPSPRKSAKVTLSNDDVNKVKKNQKLNEVSVDQKKVKHKRETKEKDSKNKEGEKKVKVRKKQSESDSDKNGSPKETKSDKNGSPKETKSDKNGSPKETKSDKNGSPKETKSDKNGSPKETKSDKNGSPKETKSDKNGSPKETKSDKNGSPKETKSDKNGSQKETKSDKNGSPKETKEKASKKNMNSKQSKNQKSEKAQEKKAENKKTKKPNEESNKKEEKGKNEDNDKKPKRRGRKPKAEEDKKKQPKPPPVFQGRVKRLASLNAATFVNILYERSPKTPKLNTKRSKSESDLSNTPQRALPSSLSLTNVTNKSEIPVESKNKSSNTQEFTSISITSATQQDLKSALKSPKKEKFSPRGNSESKSVTVSESKNTSPKRKISFNDEIRFEDEPNEVFSDSGKSSKTFKMGRGVRKTSAKSDTNTESKGRGRKKQEVSESQNGNTRKKSKILPAKSPEEMAERKKKANLARLKKAKELLRAKRQKAIKDKDEDSASDIDSSSDKEEEKQSSSDDSLTSSSEKIDDNNIVTKVRAKRGELFRSARTHVSVEAKTVFENTASSPKWCECCQTSYFPSQPQAGMKVWLLKQLVDKGSSRSPEPIQSSSHHFITAHASCEVRPYSSPTHVPMMESSPYVSPLVSHGHVTCSGCGCGHSGMLHTAQCQNYSLGGVGNILSCQHYSGTYTVPYPPSSYTRCGCASCCPGNSYHHAGPGQPLLHQPQQIPISTDASILLHHPVQLQMTTHDAQHSVPIQLSQHDSSLSSHPMPLHLSHSDSSLASQAQAQTHLDQSCLCLPGEVTNVSLVRSNTQSDLEYIDVGNEELAKSPTLSPVSKKSGIKNKTSSKLAAKMIKLKKVNKNNETLNKRIKKSREQLNKKMKVNKLLKNREKIQSQVKKQSKIIIEEVKKKSKILEIKKKKVSTSDPQLEKGTKKLTEKDKKDKVSGKRTKKEAVKKVEEVREIEESRQETDELKEELRAVHGWTWDGEASMKKVMNIFDGKEVQRKCYNAIRHDDGEIIQVKDCILVCSGRKMRDIPYVAKVTSFWEDDASGEMMMTILWYYRPEHIEGGRKPEHETNELFAAKHRDESLVACIEDRGYVLTFNEYCRYMGEVQRTKGYCPSRKKVVPDLDEAPQSSRMPPVDVDPENVFLCRHVYDLKLKRVLKNPS